MAVRRILANAASKYRDCAVLGVDRLTTYASVDIACFAELEHLRGRIGPGGEFGEERADVTTICERRDSGWSLVHRHLSTHPQALTAPMPRSL